MPVFTLAELRAKVLGRLDDNSGLHVTEEVDWVINECLRTVALATGFYRVTVTRPNFTVAGRLVYDTPEGIVVPLSMVLDGRLLQRISLARLARLRRNWVTDTTESRGRVEYWAPIGIGKFVISPKDARGGREISITGLAAPPLLVNATDTMALENEYVEIITEYAVHRLPLKEGGKIFADGSLALRTFYSKLKERRRYESLKFPGYWLLEDEAAGQAVTA